MKRYFVLLVMVTLLAGCSRRNRQVETAPSDANPPSSQPSVPTGSDEDAAAAARREVERRRSVLEERVHFAYDRSDITDEGREILDRKLAILNADQNVRIRVEGHADERGSVEYNLALSLRRANAARAYLLDGGVASARMEVGAFGEEQPLVTGSNEDAWAANRRAEFRILSGL